MQYLAQPRLGTEPRRWKLDRRSWWAAAGCSIGLQHTLLVALKGTRRRVLSLSPSRSRSRSLYLSGETCALDIARSIDCIHFGRPYADTIIETEIGHRTRPRMMMRRQVIRVIFGRTESDIAEPGATWLSRRHQSIQLSKQHHIALAALNGARASQRHYVRPASSGRDAPSGPGTISSSITLLASGGGAHFSSPTRSSSYLDTGQKLAAGRVPGLEINPVWPVGPGLIKVVIWINLGDILAPIAPWPIW